jgi:superfamily II RNA helicase
VPATALLLLPCCSSDNPDAVRDKLVPAFLRGIASHHAGCLPAWKSLVERCFQKGLLKLVYATGLTKSLTRGLTKSLTMG